MTKTNQRRTAISVCTVAALALVMLLLAFFNPFKTEAAEITPETFAIEMAQVRKHTTDTASGYLRFVVRVGNTVYEDYDIADGWTYGTLLIPEDMLLGEQLTQDTANVLNIEAKKWQTADENYHTYTAVLKGTSGDDSIPETFFNRPIVARGYVTNGEEIFYTETLTRSIGYVATMNVAVSKSETLDGYDLASGMAGTRTDVTLTDTETALGITSVKEYTFGGFQNAAFAGLDLTEYESVKFYVYRPSDENGGGGSVYDATDGGYNLFYFNPKDSWVEIELKKGESGYDIYVNGTKNEKALKDDVPLTNLNQLALNGTNGTVRYSDIQVTKIPAEVLLNIAEKTERSLSFDKTTLVNSSDKIVPNVIFGGVSVPEEQLSLLNITYTTDGSGIAVDEDNSIIPNGTGSATVDVSLSLGTVGSISSSESVIINSHELVHHDAVVPDCDTAGASEYWSCSGCAGVYYTDANADTSVDSVVIEALGHTYEEAYRTDATYTEKGWIFEACTRCKDEISEAVDMLGYKVIEGAATLSAGSNFTIVALSELGGTTEYANPSGYTTSVSDTDWATGHNVIRSNVQKGTGIGTDNITSFFRITLGIDFTKYVSTTFEFGMNYDYGEFVIGGVTVKIPSANAWNAFKIMGDGSVFLGSYVEKKDEETGTTTKELEFKQVEGAQMTGNSIVFELDTNRPDTYYGAFTIKTAVSYTQEVREYELALGDITSTPISALDGTTLTPWAADPAVAEKTVSGVTQNVIYQQIQNYKDGDGNKTAWSYFRYTIELNYKQFGSITIPIATNVITDGAFDVYVDGVKGVITTGNTWSYITVMQDGTVYFDDVLMEGALVEDYIIIELDTHRPTGTYYGEFYIGTPTFTLSEKTPIYNWEALDIDLGVNANGTKTDGNVGYAEDKLGITSVTEFTFSGTWQNSALATLDLTQYEMVKFYLYRPSENGGGAIYDAGDGASSGGIIYPGDAEYVDTWVEIILKKSVNGDYYILYVNGERQRVEFKDGEAFTNLNQLALNGTSGKIKYSDVKVVPIPVTEPVWETLGSYDLASGMSGTKTDVTLTDTETALGITKVTQYAFAGWQHTAFTSLDLTKYESVKFYMYRPSDGAGAIYDQGNGGSDGGIVFLGDAGYVGTWVEIKFMPGESGYDMYVNGTKNTFTLKSGNPLTNLNQLALNGNSTTGTIKYSNVQVVKSDEKWDSIDINLTSGMGNGTTADGTVTDADAELGITSVKTFTVTGWGNNAFASFDLTQYDYVKFYIKATTGGTLRDSAQNQFTENFYILTTGDWDQIELIKGTDGYDLYRNGTQLTLPSGITSLTNLSQICLNANSGNVVSYSNLIVPHVPALEYVTDKNYNLASGMAGTKTDVTLTDTETALGITFAKEYTFNGFQNSAFASFDLTPYESVKLYMYYPSTNGGGSIKDATDGSYNILYLSNYKDQWVELEIKKAESGEGYVLYANGTAATALKDSAVLTNLNQLALNGSLGTVKYSNIMVTYAGYYVEPEIEYDEEETNNDYTILFESDNTQVNYAAVELQYYFKEATGTLLFKNPYKSVNAIKGNMIVLGVLPASDKGFDLTGLGNSDYVIKKDGNVIYIYGTTGYGVINGVYALLGDLFDLKFYYEDTYTITKSEGFELTVDAVTEKTSSLTFDYIWSGLGELKPTQENGYSEDYAYQMGFVTDYYVAYNSVHNATTLLEEYKETHPEWFYSESGKTYGQIYLAAENFATGEGTLVTTVAEKLFTMLKEDTKYEREIALIFSAMDEDIWPNGTGYENSDALYNKYGTYAAENIMFMNAVAKELDAMITADPLGRTIQLEMLCYNKTLVAPDLTGLSDDDKAAIMMYSGTNISVVPMIAPVEGNRYLSFEDSRNKVKNPATGEIDSGSKTIAEVIEGWQALANGNDMHMWWYASDGYNFFVMMDTITNMQANYKFAAEHGITVMYNQSQGNNAVAPDWSRLKIYVQSELQKNVNADVDALIDEWMDVYFGAGAESMKTLLSAQKTWYANFFDEVFEENAGHYTAGGFCYSDDIAKWHFAENPSKPFLSYFDKTNNTMLVTWMGYIEAAKTAINADTSLTDEQKTELCNRVDLESLTIRYTLIDIFDTTTYDSSTSEFYQYAKSLGVTRSAEGTLIP